MKIIEVENNKYEIIKDYKNGFDEEKFINHYTDFFEDYDYIVGDIAYGKLRLKGFYSDGNKKAKNINNFKFVSNYLENDCAVDCKYYILKKEDLTTMGLSNINIEPNEYYIVNYDNMEVLYTKGIKVGDNEYYKLSDFNNLSDEKEIVKEDEK